MKNKVIKYLILIINLVLPCILQAEPWVDTSNVFLRSNIQHLSDSGLLKTPVTTFPLMWNDIASDLNELNLNRLTEKQKNSFFYIKNQLRLAQRNQKTLSFNVASNDKRFTGFGNTIRDGSNVSLKSTFMTQSFAANFSSTYSHSPVDGDYLRYDGSYLATYIGNWVFSVGMQDRWWGPSWDTSLSLTNNARPIPAITVSRKSAIGFEIPFTDYSIPWTVTSFMGQMDDNRIIEDTLLWGFRLNFKPTKNLEIGISRLAQWSGKNRPSDLKTFGRVLLGEDNCGGNGPTIQECLDGKEPGNQMAGYDIRWSSLIFEQPLALYFSMFAEDGDRSGGLSLFGEERYQIGIDTKISFLKNNWRVFLEATDTYAKCSDGVNGNGTSNIGNCYYEHGTYQTGMRYNLRNIGSLYENDASTYVLGLISQADNDTNYEFKLRWLQLNKDNSDRSPNNTQIGNTLTEIAENVLMLSTKIQHSYKNWRFTLGADISQSKFDSNIKNNNDINTHLIIEYNL